MVQTPWRRLAQPEPEAEYLALISYLPLRRYRMIPSFLRYSRAIGKQLERTQGALGYSVRAKFLSRMFWTLSVWRDEEALMRFVREGAHEQTMVAMRPHMGGTAFVRWRLRGSEVPPRLGSGPRQVEVGEGRRPKLMMQAGPARRATPNPEAPVA